MAKELNECKSLGDFIEAAISIYEEKGKTLTIDQAFSEGQRLQRMWNADILEARKVALEDAEMYG